MDYDIDRLSYGDSLTNSYTFTFMVEDDDTAGPNLATNVVSSQTDWSNNTNVTVRWSTNLVTDASGVATWRIATNPPSDWLDGTAVGLVTQAVVNLTTNDEGIITNYWLFAVDADGDRSLDQMYGPATGIVTMLDLTAPPSNTLSSIAYGDDDTSEIRLDWTACANAGNRSRDDLPLSPWRSYRLYYTDDGATVPSTNSAYFDYVTQPVLATNDTTLCILSNLVFDTHYKIRMAGVDRAGNVGPLTTVLNITLQGFNVTQGLVHVASKGADIWWKAATNAQGGVDREYDLIYVDNTSFGDPLSNRWNLLLTGWTNTLRDTGAVDRAPPLYLGDTMRFYRAARKDYWRTNRVPRIASVEVYGLKVVRIHNGHNWVAVPVIPDDSDARTVLGFSMPGADTYANRATYVSWYQQYTGYVAKTEIWLQKTASVTQWVYSVIDGEPIQGPLQSADTQALDLTDGFVIEVSTNLARQTNYLQFIGRVPTNRMEKAIEPRETTWTLATWSRGAYNLVGFRTPRWVGPGDLGLLESGFQGGTSALGSDRIRKFTRGAGQDGFGQAGTDVWYDTASSKWRLAVTGNPECPANYFGPDDAIIIWTVKSSTPWTWTNKMLYTPPAKNMNP